MIIEDDSTKANTIICDCTGTTQVKIEALIMKGKNTLDQISSATGAGTGCGSCDILILELVNKSKGIQ
ncbi:MAG: (2Fe-2S)-binding protein [Methylococcales bacterium]|nr:(2Fe-2S)-binding protein [Methylococcales bacterium]